MASTADAQHRAVKTRRLLSYLFGLAASPLSLGLFLRAPGADGVAFCLLVASFLLQRAQSRHLLLLLHLQLLLLPLVGRLPLLQQFTSSTYY